MTRGPACLPGLWAGDRSIDRSVDDGLGRVGRSTMNRWGPPCGWLGGTGSCRRRGGMNRRPARSNPPLSSYPPPPYDTTTTSQFKPFSGTFLMKGYHPLAGGLLDDASPLMWTKVNVQVRPRPFAFVSGLLRLGMGWGSIRLILDYLCDVMSFTTQHSPQKKNTAAGAKPARHHARRQPRGARGGGGQRGGGQHWLRRRRACEHCISIVYVSIDVYITYLPSLDHVDWRELTHTRIFFFRSVPMLTNPDSHFFLFGPNSSRGTTRTRWRGGSWPRYVRYVWRIGR